MNFDESQTMRKFYLYLCTLKFILLIMMQSIFHYSCHFIFIGFIAFLWDKKNWEKGWLILALTMLVDLDHALASPIFDPTRCSIGYHPLHSPFAILFYFIGLLIPNKISRLIFIGLIFHMITDTIDCFWTFSKCRSCFEQSIFYFR